jgi:hypothetical protein
MDKVMDPIFVIIGLFAIAGGGIVVIDTLIIRRLRRGSDDRIDR